MKYHIIKISFLIQFLLFTSYLEAKELHVIFLSRFDAKKASSTDSAFNLDLINRSFADEQDRINNQSATLPPIDAVNSDLPHCDPKSYHSFYCPPKKVAIPKKKIEPPRPIELFIDVSSSFQFIDPLESKSCARKDFVLKILNLCKKKNTRVSLYNTKLFNMSSPDELCQVEGLNNKKKLIEWIKASRSEKIVLVTDVYEYEKEFYDDLKKLNAIFYGDKVNNLIDRKNLVSVVSKINFNCE